VNFRHSYALSKPRVSTPSLTDKSALKWIAAAILGGLLAAATGAKAPYIAPNDDRRHFGDPANILFWTPGEKVAGFRNQNLIFPARAVPRGEQVYPLPESFKKLGSTRFSFDGRDLTIDEYITSYNTAGLLVIKDGVIVYEHYGLGNERDTHWTSFSVTKSVTSMLLGAAIRDGYIDHVDEPVTKYLPQLQDSAYDGVNIRHLLTMTSGVEWDETYSDPESDINTVQWPSQLLYKHLRLSARNAEPGTIFNYSTAETQLVGDLVRSATGRDLSTYLSNKIWRPFGMEQDGYWQLTAADQGEFGGSSLSATLRDYGRLGLFALGGGVLPDGSPVLTDDWLKDSVSPSHTNPRYGFQWWLGKNGVYEASGIFGQSIYVDPENGVVIAQHSARDEASNKRDWAAQSAAFRALVEAVSD
jgi:CubicO group peptidase (beta-lactamase class C family)